MNNEELLKEFESTIERLIENGKYIGSQDFKQLNEAEKQKYIKEKKDIEDKLGFLSKQMGGIANAFAYSMFYLMQKGNCGFHPNDTLKQ